MIGSFAGITFTVSHHRVRNFQNLTMETSGRYANHEVFGRKPKKEFLGPGLDAGSFTMELSAYQGVCPLSVIRSLESFIRKGQVSHFILGGRNLGRFVITAKSDAYEVITQGGRVVKAKVDVTMEEYQ